LKQIIKSDKKGKNKNIKVLYLSKTEDLNNIELESEGINEVIQ